MILQCLRCLLFTTLLEAQSHTVDTCHCGSCGGDLRKPDRPRLRLHVARGIMTGHLYWMVEDRDWHDSGVKWALSSATAVREHNDRWAAARRRLNQ